MPNSINTISPPNEDNPREPSRRQFLQKAAAGAFGFAGGVAVSAEKLKSSQRLNDKSWELIEKAKEVIGENEGILSLQRQVLELQESATRLGQEVQFLNGFVLPKVASDVLYYAATDGNVIPPDTQCTPSQFLAFQLNIQASILGALENGSINMEQLAHSNPEELYTPDSLSTIWNMTWNMTLNGIPEGEELPLPLPQQEPPSTQAPDNWIPEVQKSNA